MGILWTLFISFLQVGVLSVGGGYAAIPLIQEQIVTVHKLLSLSEFTELITIAEMAPGPISINSATFVGQRLSGTIGALVSVSGAILPPFIICLTLAYVYSNYKDFSGVQTVLAALRPAVVALIASAGMSILILALFNTDFSHIIFAHTRWLEVGLFIGGFYLLRKYKLNAVTVILGTGIIGVCLYFALQAFQYV